MNLRHSFILFIALLSGVNGYSQDSVATYKSLGYINLPGYGNYNKLLKNGVDTNYIANYSDALMLRAYANNVYTKLTINNNQGNEHFVYKPNASVGLGLGFNYRWLGLGASFNLIKENSKLKGDKKAFDFQTQLVAKKFVSLITIQRYKGYYLNDANFQTDGAYYIRPDLKIWNLGASSYYSFNGKKFSYAAVLVQNERQKKSAGSFLAGIDFYFGSVSSDSSFVPSTLSSGYDYNQVNKVNYLVVGPGVGYAYTYVYKQKFFASLSATAKYAYNRSMEMNINENKFINESMNFNFTVWGAVGYNTDSWCLAFYAVDNYLTFPTNFSNDQYSLKNGRFRLTFAKRLLLNKKAKNTIKPIDELLDIPGDIINTIKK